MLTVWEAIKVRRSIRRFTPDDVPDEMIEQLLEAARLAPSGANWQPWRFIVARDKEVRKELRRICLEQKFVEEAPVVIVCFGDIERYYSAEFWKKTRQEYIEEGTMETMSGRYAEPEFWTHLESSPPPAYPQLLASVVANTFIAIEHIVLMATALGLGTCWVAGFTDAAELNRLFGLADNLIPAAVIPVGYIAGEIPPQRRHLDLDKILLKPQVQHTGGGV